MNKLFSKIAVFAVGAAMAVGVGVAASRSFAEAKAEEDSGTFGTGDFSGEGDSAIITWSLEDGNIQMIQHKGTGSSNVNGTYNAAGRVYKGHYLEFVATNDYKIKSIEITVNGSYYGNSMTAGIAVVDNVVTDNTTAVSRTWTSTSGGKHTISSVDTAGLEALFIQNVATESNTQLRWSSGGVKVTFDRPAQTGTITSVTALGPNNETELSFTSGYLGKTGAQLHAVVEKEGLVSTAVTWSSDDSSLVSVDETGYITVLGNSSEGVSITATSVADSTKTGSIVVKSNLEELTLDSEITNFTTAVYGSANIVSDGTNVFDTGNLSDTGLSLIRLVADKNEASQNPGFYKNAPTSLRFYTGSILRISSETKLVKLIEFTSVADNPLLESNVSLSTGSFDYLLDNFAIIDCGEGVSELDLTFSGTINFTTIKVYYAADTTPAISVASDKEELAKDEVATLTTTLLNGAAGIPTYVADPAAAVTLNPSADGLTCEVTANSIEATTDVTITVSLAGCADKQVAVTVKRDAVLTGIEIVTNPTKVEYYQNATSVDLTGIVVNKVYDSGDPEAATISELEVKSFDFSVIVASTDVTIGLKDTEFTDTFSVAVVEKPAVAEKTVAEALAAGGALTPAAGETVKGDEMKVTGYVTRINNWTSHYGNADIYIADTEGGSTTLQVYQLADQAAYEQLALGTQIKVTGTIAVYKKDADTAAKVELVEVSEIELLTTPSFTEMTVAEALTAGGALTPVAGQTVYDTKSVKVSGFLTSKGTWSGSYYNGDLFIADAKGGTPTLQILRFGIESVFNDLLVGAELEIKGILAIYKKNATTDAVVELTSPVVTVKGGGEVIELNVANALTRGNALTEPADKSSTFDTATVRITGYVVKQGEWSTQYNNADFWIADSVSDNDWLDIFRYGNKDIFDQCKPGAQVQVTGILALYKNGTKLTVELTGATVVVLTPAPELDPIETNVAGAIEACAGITPVAGQTVMLSNIQEYAVTGYVISSNWSTQYNNGSIWIVDSADAQKGAPEVQAYRFGDKDIFDQCIKGAKITITGLLGVYLKDAQSSPDYELTNCSISGIVLPAVVPTSLDYEGELEKTEYEIGEDFDTTLAGITKFVVTYSDSTTEAPHTEDKTLADVTVDASAFDKTTAGDYMIKVSYTEEETTVFFNLSVTVKPEEPGPGPEPQPVTLVDITVANSKSNYQVGDILDLDAITVIMVYSDESTREGVRSTDYGFTFPEGFDGTFTEAGEITITVYAKADETIKHDVVLTVSAAPVVLTRITVETTVTEYTVGDQIDPNSITITAHYSDGTSEVVTTGFIVTFDSSEAGDNVEVTVSYTEDGVTKSASFYVTVKAAPSGKKGCGGDIAATSIILSTLSLAGVALLALKKRKED